MRKMLAAGIVLVFLVSSKSYAAMPAAVIEVFETGISAPAGMALTPDGDLLVVSRDDTSQIYKIDLDNGQNKGLRRFSGGRDLCNSRHLAIDPNGYIYVDTSRPTTIKRTRSDWYSSQNLRWLGIFQISPDGKTLTRIEGIDDDTLGLAIDPEGNLFACTAEAPMEHQDITAKFAEKSAERMFTSAEALKPRIIEFKLGDNSSLDNRSTVMQNMDVSPADIAFNSEGDLFFAADGDVMKIHFGFLGAGKPKPFATLPTANVKATKYLGICADKSDNLYVSATNPYSLFGGTIFKVGPKGEVTTLAKDLMYPIDCITDAEGNLYISDLKAGNVLQLPAEAMQREGPFVVKKPPPPPVETPEEPVAAETPTPEAAKPEATPPEKRAAEEPTIEASQPAPAAGETDSDIARMEYKELSESLAAVEKELDKKQPLMYPDTIVLKGGRKMKCEIVSDSEDAVYANMATGSASIMRRRIEMVVYGTAKEKEQAFQAKSEVKQLELRRDSIRSRMKELRPPVKRTEPPETYGEEQEPEVEQED